MGTPLKWIESYGGPLLVLSRELLTLWHGVECPDDVEVDADFRWDGPGSRATDYDRACDVINDIATIKVGGGKGLVLNSGVKHSAALHPLSVESAIIIQCLDGDAGGIERELPTMRRGQFAPPDMFLDLRDGELLLTDSGSVGENIEQFCDFSAIMLAPGRYSIATVDYDGECDAQLVLHWLQREGTTDEVCNAEKQRPRRQIIRVRAQPDEPLFCVLIDGKSGFINRRAELVVEPRFGRVSDFSEGLATLLQAGRYGFIDTRGEIRIPPVYEIADNFCDGVARVRSDQGDGYINRQGQPAFHCPFTLAKSFREGRAPVAVEGKANRWGYIDPEGRVVIECRYDSATWFFEGLAAVTRDEHRYVIDKDGHIHCELDPRLQAGVFSEGLSGFWTEGDRGSIREVGYVDPTGAIVIGPTRDWTFAGDFSEGLAFVLTPDDRYGYIDRFGQLVIDAKFRHAERFSHGLAVAGFRRGQFGYIDKSGEFVIAPRFSAACPFRDGLANVRINGKWGYIGRDGNFVWEPSK